MGKDSKIAWTDNTFNPWWGCVRVSEACRNCYAEAWAKRTGFSVWGPTGSRRFFGEKHWSQPITWNNKAEKEGVRPRVFCASMCDVFEKLPDDHADSEAMDKARDNLWELIRKTPNLDWLLLTKRPNNINKMIPAEWLNGLPDNIWVGTTIENQKNANKNVNELLAVSAKVRFVSCEPLLDSMDISRWLTANLNGTSRFITASEARLIRRGVDWVIVGGESGSGAREMKEEWARDLRDQCRGSGAAFFMKQMGSVWAKNKGLTRSKGENLYEIPEYLRIREFPK